VVSTRSRLRELLALEQILVAPGAHDAMAAKIIEQTGFEAVYMTGFGVSASHLGQPDVGLLTMSEMVDRVRDFASAIRIPVVCDGDTGFGNVINVARTVKEYERAGAAAIQLEDQVPPKKCGHTNGRRVIPTDEMVRKIKVAVSARSDPDFVIIARTDARTPLGIDEAIERGKAYEAAGADVVFVESPESIEEMEAICRSFRVPTLANMVELGRTPFLTAARLQEIGYRLAIFPVSAILSAAKAIQTTMERLRLTGTTGDRIPDMLPFSRFNDLIGLPRITAIEKGDYSAV
jgi:2,3-dimethylmalate lyase